MQDEASLSTPVYLFIFSKGGIDYPVISTDLSSAAAKEEYSTFTITEGGNDPENGNFTLGTTGVYDLVIYEQSSSTNLDPDNATKIYEDLARVIDSEQESSYWYEHTIDLSFYEHSVA